MAAYVKGWLVFVMWLFTGLMWSVFALLYFWIHYRLFGTAFLILGILAFFIALRWQRQHLGQRVPRP
jgi:hypothetical protein